MIQLHFRMWDSRNLLQESFAHRQVVPICLAWLSSLHPVRGAAERDDDPGPRPPHHVHPPVQARPVVLPGAGLGVASPETHDMLVLELYHMSQKAFARVACTAKGLTRIHATFSKAF